VETNLQITRVIDDPTAKPVFINKIIGISVDSNGTFTLTMGDVRHIPVDMKPNPVAHHEIFVSTRLALPPHAAADLVKNLSDALTQVKALMGQPASQQKN
jgi:hypothetical protein